MLASRTAAKASLPMRWACGAGAWRSNSPALAVSTALNIAFTAGVIARSAGVGTANAILTGAGAAATSLGLYFAAIAAYQ